MDINRNSRRDFLKRLSAAGFVGISASTVLSACGGGETAEAPAAEPPAPAAAEATGCMDTTGLTDQEVAMREQLQYVDATPDPEKTCDNCALYLAAQEGSTCGGCNLIKGPIHPDGYCISWAPAQT